MLKAAADAGKLGIGVDSNQDNLFPGNVLTSMLKHVDVATYNSFMDAKNGTWKPGSSCSASRKAASTTPSTNGTRAC